MIRRVTGSSMSPAIDAGDVIVTRRRDPRVGDVVVAVHNGREVVKRVNKITDGAFYLVGDNRHESSDSRHFGSVPRGAILGVVMIRLPRAVEPPVPRVSAAHRIAYALGGVMLMMALLHLVRIDKLIPIIDSVLPGGLTAAVLFVGTVTVAEVLAMPYLLGMRLSPLARIFSGAFVVLVPLAWTCLTVWALGNHETTGQFSSYLNIPANGLLLMVNIAWLLASYWLLWLLNYDRNFTRLNKRP